MEWSRNMETKARILNSISAVLKANPDKEVCVTRYQHKLRNGRWGLHAYSICYNDGEIMCRPWSGANVYWRARLDERLTKKEMLDVWEGCKEIMFPYFPA